MKKNYTLTKEEQEILDAFEAGKLNGPPPGDEMITAAKKNFEKKQKHQHPNLGE